MESDKDVLIEEIEDNDLVTDKTDDSIVIEGDQEIQDDEDNVDLDETDQIDDTILVEQPTDSVEEDDSLSEDLEDGELPQDPEEVDEVVDETDPVQEEEVTEDKENQNEETEVLDGWNENQSQYYVNGELYKGFLELDGHKYYFDENGNLVHGFYIINVDGTDRTFYFDEEGKLVSGLYTVKEDDKSSSYYFDENGYLYYGQLYLDNYWYYFKPETGQMAIGITTILPEYNNGSEKTVYYDELGHMFFGQVKINGKWYYFQPVTGEMATNGVYSISAEYAGGKDQISIYDEFGVRLYGEVRSKDIVYYIDSNGYVTKVDITGIGYLSQRDGRWAYVYVGNYNMQNSGCFPTVMTMALNFLLNKNMSPLEIATLLHEYELFNSGGAGAGGNIVRFLADYYDLYYQNDLGQQGIIDALKKGYIVVGSVGPGYWTVPGYTHAILLYGYNNGYTHVLDPYDQTKCGLFSIAYIWAQRSTHPLDNTDNGPFFAISFPEKFIVTGKNDFEGTFEVVIGKEDGKTHTVVINVWTDAEGEANGKKYTYVLSANQYYTLKESVANHNNYYGVYWIKAFLDGRLVLTDHFTMSNSHAEVTIVDTTGNETTYQVEVVFDTLPDRANAVLIAVWSQENGQDDLHWITLKKTNNLLWTGVINIKDFLSFGEYSAHTYIRMSDGYMINLDMFNFMIHEPSSINSVNVDNENGTFDIIINDIYSPSGIKVVQVPVWTLSNGQDDLVWYTAKAQADGSYLVRVLAKNHNMEAGNYKFDIYITGNNGLRKCVESLTTTLKHSDQFRLPFIDTPEDAWFYDSVKYVYDNEIMTGLNDTEFGATQTVSRAQFATILYRLEGEPDVDYSGVFPDVTDGNFYSDAVVWANSNGIITGYTEGPNAGKFGASNAVTREEMAVMIYRYASNKNLVDSVQGDLSSFSDANSVSKFAQEAMNWCVSVGLISGNEDGTLDPQGGTSRAECATILARFMQNIL